MRIRITSAVACLALTITGLTVAAGSAAAVEQGEGQGVGRSVGLHGEAQWPVPPEVGELICEIRANLPHVPHLVPIPPCKPVNGWQ
ncbi:hypothetical protein [Streptomyces narbonensis]|uniref:hypothetical protein n=1 Tax=Streptomyces narbonensis TaxID=67333 RepID=UPI00167AA1B3|nr:hypothetical protein [Streptomyces narbonensis]